MFNAFDATASTANARSFATELHAWNKQVVDFQLRWARQAHEQSAAWMDAARNGAELGLENWLNMSQTMIDTFLPEGEDKAEG